MELNNGNQLKGYLQREVKAHPMHSNYAYNYFFCRNFLERLFGEYDKRFVLKGSFAQYATLETLTRPLTDIDIVTFGRMDDSKEALEKVLKQSDKVSFDIKQRFVTTNATINYRVLCHFDSIQHLITFDLRKDRNLDVVNKNLPPLFSADKDFNVTSITLEEHLSNKLYIVFLNLYLQTKLGKPVRRLKDFYDIYSILSLGNVDETKVFWLLNEKIKHDEFLSTYDFKNFYFENGFTTTNEGIWNEEKKKYGFNSDVSFNEVVETTNDFVNKKK